MRINDLCSWKFQPNLRVKKKLCSGNCYFSNFSFSYSLLRNRRSPGEKLSTKPSQYGYLTLCTKSKTSDERFMLKSWIHEQSGLKTWLALEKIGLNWMTNETHVKRARIFFLHEVMYLYWLDFVRSIPTGNLLLRFKE